MRFGVFNVENLFDRPAILMLKDQDRVQELLAKVRDLETELARASYDKKAIEGLYEELKDYISFNIEGKKQLFRKGKLVAKGPKDWSGVIVYKRTRFTGEIRKNTATVIKEMKADVAGLVEVEGMQVMGEFNRHQLARRYAQHLLIDSPNDPRGIDVGVYTAGPALGNIRTHVFDRNDKKKAIFSRDCLDVEFVLPGHDKSVHVLMNHFKSKMGGDPPEAQARRRDQAARVAEILAERFDLEKDWVIVAGDFNDTPDAATLAPLLTVKHLHDAFDVLNHPANDRWTYEYRGSKNQIDFILVSEALAKKLTGIEVLRRGMTFFSKGQDPAVKPYPGITGPDDAASDHAALVATFDL